MIVQVVGCSHHGTSIALRERLAFRPEKAAEALDRWRRVFPGVEAVLLSTCNRVELYAASEAEDVPGCRQVAGFLGRFHRLDPAEVVDALYQRQHGEAIRHLFAVASSLDSMVVGEPQIVAQVKEAYELAAAHDNTGPITHAAFQAALKCARRVAGETAVHQRRVSIPSVAVADFARQIFERFDDKHTVVLGAGEMAEETLRYLRDEGTHQITVINRHHQRAMELAERWKGRAVAWEQLPEALATADLIVSTSGSNEAIVTEDHFARVERTRLGRPLFILDLAVPRDFAPAIGERPDVYLYSVDDLRAACEANRRQRDRELPAAMKIVEQEADRFMAELYHRATGPIIRQLRQGWEEPKRRELERLLRRLPDLDDQAREEVQRSFDRLINKLLHPPLQSLREHSRDGVPHKLMDALRRLFNLRE
ncbi:MAG: glutamyl-tRNA reductase [Pirellulales bacterium]